jgi:poly(U)-binding-splicing factor PUF60
MEIARCRLCVENLHEDVGKGDIKDAFSAFGTIKSITMSKDPKTGKHKGFCFIEYTTPEAATLALETMAVSDLHGRFVFYCLGSFFLSGFNFVFLFCALGV